MCVFCYFSRYENNICSLPTSTKCEFTKEYKSLERNASLTRNPLYFGTDLSGLLYKCFFIRKLIYSPWHFVIVPCFLTLRRLVIYSKACSFFSKYSLCEWVLKKFYWISTVCLMFSIGGHLHLQGFCCLGVFFLLLYLML